MNKYTDSQRLKAIWDGASDPTDNHPINREMLKIPQPKTYEEFLQGLDQCIDVAVTEGYVP